jgi:small nuclear ribonucleoprotein G
MYTSLPIHPTLQKPLKSLTAKKTQYLDKRVEVQLNGSRKVMGTLRGYDVFLNIVLDEATESKPNNEKVRLGMCVIRGNAVVMLEALDRIDTDNRNRG